MSESPLPPASQRESALERALLRAEQLTAQHHSLTNHQLHEISSLWQQTTDLLPQVYSRFFHITSLAKALRAYVRASAELVS